MGAKLTPFAMNETVTVPQQEDRSAIAGMGDIEELVRLAREFVAESTWGHKFSAGAARNAFEYYIRSDVTDVVVIDGTEEIAGAAIVAVNADFTEKPLGYLDKFYVRHRYRRTRLPYQLIRRCVDWFDAQGCHDSWATATAGIGRDAGFVRLLSAHGFGEVGPMLRRAGK